MSILFVQMTDDGSYKEEATMFTKSNDVRVVGYPNDPKPTRPPVVEDVPWQQRKIEGFTHCPRCKRFLHESVVSTVCYSCSLEV